MGELLLPPTNFPGSSCAFDNRFYIVLGSCGTERFAFSMNGLCVFFSSVRCIINPKNNFLLDTIRQAEMVAP